MERTELYKAIANLKGDERLNKIASILDDGVSIHERDHNGLTPLHQAVVIGDVRVVKLLLRAGANLNAIDHYGRSPIFYTVLSQCANHTQLDKLLKDHGADTELYDVHGMRKDEFMLACRESSLYRPEPEQVIYKVRRRRPS
ncbi:ankyrin repeat domain-containing protein [Pantoea agglomerans]|uniref:ankyrin repeat domain-containing protein n=1 Tax=Enterobacter agglomerans TaxID=549 RepID=UPI003C7D49E0